MVVVVAGAGVLLDLARSSDCTGVPGAVARCGFRSSRRRARIAGFRPGGDVEKQMNVGRYQACTRSRGEQARSLFVEISFPYSANRTEQLKMLRMLPEEGSRTSGWFKNCQYARTWVLTTDNSMNRVTGNPDPPSDDGGAHLTYQHRHRNH